MEQAIFSQLLDTFQTQVGVNLQALSVMAGQPTAPLVVLVHGIGGNDLHWSDPIHVDINETWLFDINAKPAYKHESFLTSPPYQGNAVSSWIQVLSANGLSWVNFKQAQSQGALQVAVDELKTILSGLEQVVYAAFTAVGESGPPLVLLCHSRGGLVTRLALKQLGSAGVSHLSKVITLHTPHHGSYMPKLSNDYNNLVNSKIKFNNVLSSDLPGPIRTLVNDLIGQRIVDLETLLATFLKGTFGTQPSGVGFDEMIPGSQTLQDLTQDEQPWPGVQYYSFGGGQPKFVAVYVGIVDQVLHLLDVVGGFLFDELLEQPEIQKLYGGLAELEKGDSAVSLVSSHWPDTFQDTHQDFPINHMQALIHQPLQSAVLQIIKS
jgi:hypothetical protein